MNKKLLTAMFASAMLSVNANAQYEGMTDINEIIGGSEEHVTQVRQWLSMFQSQYDAKDYADAYQYWGFIINDSPHCNLGIYSKGAYMLSQMIATESDQEKKATYFKDLMRLYDVRLANLAALNSWQRTEKNKTTEGDVMVLKAYYYCLYAPTCSNEYSLLTGYKMFAEAIESVRTKGGKDVPYYALDTYMRVSAALYQQDNTQYREQFLQDYLSCREVCEIMLEQAKTETNEAKAQQIVNNYDPVLQLCDALFAESGAGDREQIVAIFTPKVEENKDNLAYLKKALTLMSDNNCDDTDCYYQAAEYAYQIEPSFESAIGTAQKLTKDGNHEEAIVRYNKAIELAQTDRTRGSIAIKVATAMSRTGQFAEAHSYLDKAVEYNPDLLGRAQYNRAQVYVHQQKYDAAVAACDEAIAADITLQGQAARLKDNVLKAKAQIAEGERKRAEYEADKKKRDEEDNFFN